MPSSNSSPNKKNKKEIQNTWQKGFFKKPGTRPGAFIGMVLGFAIGFYPSILLGPFAMSFFPHPKADIPFCIGLGISCVAITACYFLGFALGGMAGYYLGKCCSVSSFEKEIENGTIKNNTPYTKG